MTSTSTTLRIPGTNLKLRTRSNHRYVMVAFRAETVYDARRDNAPLVPFAQIDYRTDSLDRAKARVRKDSTGGGLGVSRIVFDTNTGEVVG